MGKSKAFTLIELVAVILVFAVVVSLASAIVWPREKAKRTLCGANLKALGMAMAQYKGENSDSYPWLVNSGTAGKGMIFNAPLAKSADTVYGLVPSSSKETQLNILDNLNLLVQQNQTTYRAFLCPSTGAVLMKRGDGVNNNYGFVSANEKDNNGRPHIDYAYQIGYTYVGKSKVPNPAALTDQLDGGVVILADAPAAVNTLELNTSDFDADRQHVGYAHGTDGVNVLYASGGACWSDKTIRCGWGKNNIYLQDVTFKVVNGVETPEVDAKAKGGQSIVYKPEADSCRYDSVLFWGK